MPGFERFGRPGKRLAIAVGVVLFIIAAWVVVGRLSASLSDRYESFYPSLAEAAKDGAITRGWIPEEFLPRSSRSIHEVHDLSPSRAWGAFEFVPSDSQNLLANLKHVDVPPPSVQAVPSPGVSWWPPILASNLDIDKIHKSGFDLYFVERPATSVTTSHWLFAIDWSKGRGFFYYT
jgi:hypothetical protein